MATILALSSYVCAEPIGLGASRFALERLGHTVLAVPTVVLSSIPDQPPFAHLPVPASLISDSLAAWDGHGRLDGIDAVFTGYLPTAGHVEAAAAAVTGLRARRPELVVLVDPVLGDDPGGLYIPLSAAEALRDLLLPQATITTPNRFELAWLSGAGIDGVAQAMSAGAELLPSRRVVVGTSIPSGDGTLLANVLCGADCGVWPVPRRAHAPHGTGDFLAGLILAHRLKGCGWSDAIARATAGAEIVVAASEGRATLDLIGTQAAWAEASPWPAQQAA